MDSFFLAEMFKYLYLLFEEDENLVIDPQNYVFTTEAHMLPLELSNFKNYTAKITPFNTKLNFDGNPDRSCPNPLPMGRTGTLFQTEDLNLWRQGARNWMMQSNPNFWVKFYNIRFFFEEMLKCELTIVIPSIKNLIYFFISSRKVTQKTGMRPLTSRKLGDPSSLSTNH